MPSTSRVLIVASQHYVDTLSGASVGAMPRGIRVEAVEAEADVAADLLAGTTLLVLEVAPGSTASRRRLTAIREAHPGLLLVAAISDANMALVRTLVREGISDVVSLPINLDEVQQVALDVVARHEAARTVDAHLAPLVAVVRSIGGCGATSIATHLAADLAAHSTGKGAVIVDLDLQFGSVAHYLGVTSRGDISALLDAGDRLDEELLKSVTGYTADGLAVIAAPDTIMPLESVDTDQMLRVVQLLRQQFDYVVIDLPANWTNWTLSATVAADVIVMVVELSIASLRQAQRRLELFKSVGIAERAVEIVVNRVEKRLFRTIDLDDVSKTLKHSVLGSIALDSPLVNTAQNQGHLVNEVQRKSKFWTDIAAIGEALRTGNLARIK